MQEDNIRSDRLVPVGSATGGCGTLSRDRTCHFVSRFCRSSTWQINEHVLLLVIKLKLAHLPEGTDVVSVRAVRVMAVEIHVSVAAAAAAAISLMWHICGSWWRWSVSSAPRIYFFAVLSPPSATSEIKFGEGLKMVLLLLLLYFTPPPKEVKLTKGRNGGAPRVASEGFLGVLACFVSAPPTASLRIWAWCEPITLLNEWHVRRLMI